MSKIIQAILAGMLFTFLLDFFFFLGIMLHYIDFYNINLYYNILFADHQNIYIYFTLSALFGYLIIYTENKTTIFLTTVALFVSLSTLIPYIGHLIGEKLLMSKNIQLNDAQHHYVGDIYYNGRDKITFYDTEINKMIVLEKNRLKEK